MIGLTNMSPNKPKWHLAVYDLHARCGWSYAELARVFQKDDGEIWWICNPEARQQRDTEYRNRPAVHARRLAYMADWRAERKRLKANGVI